MKRGNEDSSKFMMESYKDLSQNVMHIEGQMFNHMSFFLTLFIGILTASVAVFQITRAPNQTFSITEAVAIFSMPFLFLCFIGQFELQMIMQLRVRKIKFIEGIAKAREFYIEHESILAKYIVLPAKLEKTPPYLRISSEDWYKLLFVMSLNAVSFLLFWIGLLPFLSFFFEIVFNCNWVNSWLDYTWLRVTWIILGFVLSVIHWRSLHRKVTHYCKRYDQKREKEMGKPTEYDLLEFELPKSKKDWFISDWFIYFEKRKKTK